MLRSHISAKRLCQRLRNASVPLTPQTAPTIPIYSMKLPRLQASTYEEANTTLVMWDLFSTLSGETRLALGRAQLSSLGQHRSTAFLCWVLSRLGSWPCIPSHIVQACARGNSSPWPLPTGVGWHTSPWSQHAHLHGMLVKTEPEHEQTGRAQCGTALASLPHLCLHCSTWMRSLHGPNIPHSGDLRMGIYLISPGVLGPPKTPILQGKADLHAL